jgi:Ca2+-binding EF-hand superfamily protein
VEHLCFQVFAAFDTVKSGVLEQHQFFAASAACGLLFSERECEEILSTVETNSSGMILYQSFINRYTQ